MNKRLQPTGFGSKSAMFLTALINSAIARNGAFLAVVLIALPGVSGPLPQESPTFHQEFETLFHASLDFYSQLQRTTNGLYRDAFVLDQSKPPSRICSTAATGVGLMALCMDYELGRNPAAPQEALQTLRAINGKTAGFSIGREKAGYFKHFFSSEDGSGKSPYSTVDTAIMVVGTLYCRNTFNDPQIKVEADQLWNSIDWSLALAQPNGEQLYMQMEDGRPRESSRTFLFNEYYLLAWLIKESQIQKTGHSDVISFRELNTWTNQGLKLLCSNGHWPQCSFLVQFPFYMCHPCATDPLYREFVLAQARADQRECSQRVGVAEFWGCGAGGTPSHGYRANNYRNNPDNIVSPHIIAGFMPVFPLAQEHLLKLYRDHKRRVQTPVGDLLPRFSVDRPDWHAGRIEAIDFSSMLFGLAGIHPQLGMKFFDEKTQFTFNQKN